VQQLSDIPDTRRAILDERLTLSVAPFRIARKLSSDSCHLSSAGIAASTKQKTRVDVIALPRLRPRDRPRRNFPFVLIKDARDAAVLFPPATLINGIVSRVFDIFLNDLRYII